MVALLSAAQIYEHIDDKPPTSADALRERYGNLVKQVSPDGKEIWLNWIVRTGTPGAAIGYVQATIRKETNIALVAYVLSPNHLGKGLACEAVTQMIDKLSDGYGVKIFHISTTPPPSLRFPSPPRILSISHHRVDFHGAACNTSID